MAYPTETKGFDGQNRGNSGIFLQELYELQVLDSYHNPTYANGQAGSIYKQAMPLVNASRAPGQWQAYDIIWKGPRFSPGGGLLAGAHHGAAQRCSGAGRYRCGGQDRVHRSSLLLTARMCAALSAGA